MKTKFYPQTFLQSLILIIIPLVITSPFAFVKKLNLFSESIFSIILFSIYFLTLIVFYFFKNKKQIHFNIKINKIINFFSIFIIVFQIAIYIPINFYFNNFTSDSTNTITSSFIPLIGLILSAIFEELIFRGIILKGYLIKYSPKKSIIISSIFFGIIHLNPPQIFGAISLGVITGYVYYYSRSVGMTIILHVVFNITAIVTQFFHINYGNSEIKEVNHFYGSYSISIIVISILLFIYLIFYFIKNRQVVENKLQKLNIKN